MSPAVESQEFEDFVRARGAGLGRLAYLLIGDAHEAEDVLQSVLARLASHWDRVARMDNVDAYVRTALTDATASWWRRHRRRRDLPTEIIPDRAVLDADTSERSEIVDLLRRLPPRQRSVIVLRYYEDHSEAEIAAMLGCSLGTVKSQASKARATLQSEWAALHPTTTAGGAS